MLLLDMVVVILIAMWLTHTLTRPVRRARRRR